MWYKPTNPHPLWWRFLIVGFTTFPRVKEVSPTQEDIGFDKVNTWIVHDFTRQFKQQDMGKLSITNSTGKNHTYCSQATEMGKGTG